MDSALQDGDVSKARQWGDAQLALALVALDPASFGGIVVRAHAGPVRDRLMAGFLDIVEAPMPVRRMPSHIADERLLGGLDMAATLNAGRPVSQRGLLSEVDCGVLIVPMAERMEALTVSRLTAVLDRGEVVLERDGLTAVMAARLAVVALDEGLGADECVSPALADRLAFACDLADLSIHDAAHGGVVHRLGQARSLLDDAPADERLIAVMSALASAFGITSIRAVLFAMRAARGIAALDGRSDIEDDDIEAAARLVLAPRATRLPMHEDESESPPEEADEQDSEQNAPHEDEQDERDDPPPPADGPLEDRVLEAVEAAIPAQLLARLKLAAALGRQGRATGGNGAKKAALMRGRPIGSWRGKLDGKNRLHVIDTLRAAAPWQGLRAAQRSAAGRGRIIVTSEDIRVRRFKQNEESVTIFLVDASGSAALHRLGEVKGAVELLLAQSYARRDQVALIVFRGQGAELVLPPTRSLVRAKRCLAGVPGGGGTPLAAGLDAGLEVALECRRAGRTPQLVVLSDGQANVGYDPATGRAGGRADALCAATRLAQYQLSSLFIDTSPKRGAGRSSGLAMDIAQAMGAVHLALPYPNAAGLKELVETGRACPAPRLAG
jgi:magnesium chelatase subunit D